MVRSAASNISDFDLVKERKVAEEEDKKVRKSIGVPSVLLSSHPSVHWITILTTEECFFFAHSHNAAHFKSENSAGTAAGTRWEILGFPLL